MCKIWTVSEFGRSCNYYEYIGVVVMGQELYPLGIKVLIVLCQSESVIRQSSRSDTRDIRRRWRMKRECYYEYSDTDCQSCESVQCRSLVAPSEVRRLSAAARRTVCHQITVCSSHHGHSGHSGHRWYTADTAGTQRTQRTLLVHSGHRGLPASAAGRLRRSPSVRLGRHGAPGR